MSKDECGFLERRVVKLFVDENYKVFLLTGQGGGRLVDIRPFNSFSAEEVASLKAQASPVTPSDRITLSFDLMKLSAHDGFTGRSNSIDANLLDDDVRKKLCAASPWKKLSIVAPGFEKK